MDLSGIQLLLDAAAMVSGCSDISQYIRDEGLPGNSSSPLISMPSVACYEEVYTQVSTNARRENHLNLSVVSHDPDISFENIDTSTPKKRFLHHPLPRSLNKTSSFSGIVESPRYENDLRRKVAHDPRVFPSSRSTDAGGIEQNSSAIGQDLRREIFLGDACNISTRPCVTLDTEVPCIEQDPRDPKAVQPSRDRSTCDSGNQSFTFSVAGNGEPSRTEHDRRQIIHDQRNKNGNVESSRGVPAVASVSSGVESLRGGHNMDIKPCDILRPSDKSSSIGTSTDGRPYRAEQDLRPHSVHDPDAMELLHNEHEPADPKAVQSSPNRGTGDSGNKSFTFSVAGNGKPSRTEHDRRQIIHDPHNKNVIKFPRDEHELRDQEPVHVAHNKASQGSRNDPSSFSAFGKVESSRGVPSVAPSKNTAHDCQDNAESVADRAPRRKTIRVTRKKSIDTPNSDSESQCGDIDDDDQEVRIGDLTLFNEFIIDEYFEKYQNLSLLGDDDEPVITKENEVHNRGSSDKCETLSTNTNSPPSRPLTEVQVKDGDLGFDEMNTDHVSFKIRKVNQRKLAQRSRMRGLQYKQTNGRVLVPARHVKPPCSCKRLCFEKYDDSTRKKLLQNLLLLTTSGQNQFLSNHMAVRTTVRPKVPDSRRLFSRSYYLPGVNGRIKVCKEMFMSTFDIKDKKTRLLADKQLIGRGISADDLRANNGTHKALSEDELEYITQHIRSFPAYTSHYGREKSDKLYLSSDLSVLKMHGLYKTKCKEDGKQPAHYQSYRRVFKKLNIGFRSPKIDTCAECDKFAIALKLCTDEERPAIEAARDAHHKRAEEAYRQKKADVAAAKSDPRRLTASGDLQKCLPTPHLNTGIAYYKRQMYTLNFTVFSTHGSNSVDCYLWDESKAKRGSQEIGSCIWKYLSEMDPCIEEVVFYSDRCSGQNHNIVVCMVMLMFVEQCQKEGRKMTITHKFMVPGHTHMEVDSAHAAIERAKKRMSGNIETPRDWAVFISAIQRKVPFMVHELEQSEFLAFKSLDEFYTRPKKNLANEPVRFKDISAFKYSSDEPGMVSYKYELSDSDFMSFEMREDFSIPVTLPPPITNEPIPLSEEKLADLRSLMPFIKNSAYYATMLREIVPKKKGRRPKTAVEDHFENDLDPEEPNAIDDEC